MEYEEKIRKMQKELKNYKEKIHIDQQTKSGNHLEKKLSEFIDNEKRLLNEIEQLKRERDFKVSES